MLIRVAKSSSVSLAFSESRAPDWRACASVPFRVRSGSLASRDRSGASTRVGVVSVPFRARLPVSRRSRRATAASRSVDPVAGRELLRHGVERLVEAQGRIAAEPREHSAPMTEDSTTRVMILIEMCLSDEYGLKTAGRANESAGINGHGKGTSGSRRSREGIPAEGVARAE